MNHFPSPQMALLSLTLLATGSPAAAYPAGAAVSVGSNPIASFSGVLSVNTSSSTPTSTALVSVPSDQVLILTDISFYARSNDPQCMDMMQITLTNEDGPTGNYDLATRFCYGSNGCSSDGVNVEQSLRSGLLVSPSTTLSLSSSKYQTWTWSGCNSSRAVSIQYTISGYYAQP